MQRDDPQQFNRDTRTGTDPDPDPDAKYELTDPNCIHLGGSNE